MEKEYILEKFAENQPEISTETAEKFAVYCNMLVSWSKKMNLTAVTDEKEIVTRHFIDSLLPLQLGLIPENAVCVDVGTGAGFPGMPIAILRPDIQMTLMDSLQKRLVFLDAVCAEIGAKNCETVHIRAEDAAKTPLYREKYGIAFSRAVAKTVSLSEICLPLVKVGGKMLALKSLTAKEELDEASYAAELLGGNEGKILGTDERNVTVIEKIRPTPVIYPRKAGSSERNPLIRPQ